MSPARPRGAGRARGGRSGGGAPSAPPPSRTARVVLLLARLWVGAFFLAAVHHKLFFEGYTFGENLAHFRDVDFVDQVRAGIENPPHVLGWRLDAWSGFLEGVMLPGRSFFAPAILALEALVGASLVLGAFVRLTAALGAALLVAFALSRSLLLVSVAAANWPTSLLLLLLSVLAAGRWAGLDAWLRPRLPGWLRWAT